MHMPWKIYGVDLLWLLAQNKFTYPWTPEALSNRGRDHWSATACLNQCSSQPVRCWPDACFNVCFETKTNPGEQIVNHATRRHNRNAQLRGSRVGPPVYWVQASHKTYPRSMMSAKRLSSTMSWVRSTLTKLTVEDQTSIKRQHQRTRLHVLLAENGTMWKSFTWRWFRNKKLRNFLYWNNYKRHNTYLLP